MWLQLLLSSALVHIWFESVSAVPDKVVCYYETARGIPVGGLTIADVAINLCTHINIAFLGISSGGGSINMTMNPSVPHAFFALKKENPKIKLLFSIGGWSEGSEKFSIIAASASSRKTFVNNVLQLLQSFRFDGVDIAWEYPGQRGGNSSDRYNFPILLSEFRTEFDKRGYLLTAIVSPRTSFYEVLQIARYLDFINVVAYERRGASINLSQEISASMSNVKAWMSAGAPPEKLIMGTTSMHCSYTGENGFLGYLNSDKCTSYHELCAKASTRSIASQLVELNSIKAKVTVYMNLGGMFIWTANADDYKGACGTKNPILNAIRNEIKPEEEEEICECVCSCGSASGSSSGSEWKISFEASVCKEEGFVRDQSDCSKYYQCKSNGDSYKAQVHRCDAGLYFDPNIADCNLSELVTCP